MVKNNELKNNNKNCRFCGIEHAEGLLIYCDFCVSFIYKLGEFLDGVDKRKNGILSKNNKKLSNALWKIRTGELDLEKI